MLAFAAKPLHEDLEMKVQPKLQVASCGLRLKSPLQYAVDVILNKNATRNFYAYVFFALYLFVYWYIYILYIYYYICIYIYILYII